MSSSLLPLLQVQLNQYVLPIIIILGNIGNAFIVVLFIQHRRNSCSMYLILGAIMNSAFMTLNIPITLYTINYGDPTIRSLSFCKIRFYLYHVWGQIARYAIVLACVDRFIMTSNYARLRVMNRYSLVKWIIGIVCIFWHIFPVHILILMTITSGRCGPTDIYYLLYYIYLLVFVCIIPSTIMVICALLTYRNMRQLHTRVQPIGINNAGENNRITIHRRDRDLLSMVLAEVAIYVVTTFVYPFIIMEISISTTMGVTKSVTYLQIESFISNFGTILIYFNSAVPFYTYFLVSKPFRKEFKQFFSKWMRQTVGENNTNEPLGTRQLQN
ncbi:unnamed protein product [Adineta steineri]|uniref:G-protein coupled receptors family 1 profile domain-containing protein n=1 Tax=Adineta steineri TaxID=433720 RepID=A0A819H0S0_9BILA|nr:unnamed protein product [Adineta steineri]CAF3889771.1 unnamed protein product [Adineta steineri]